jgi:hypothetical protein
MNALEALKAAQTAGIDTTIDGDDLVLQSSAPPPPSVLDALSRHKAEVVALLRSGNNGWAGEDYQALEAETKGMSWAEWKAAELNRLFEDQGVTGEPSRITAATVQHGERRLGEPAVATRQAVHRPHRGTCND